MQHLCTSLTSLASGGAACRTGAAHLVAPPPLPTVAVPVPVAVARLRGRHPTGSPNSPWQRGRGRGRETGSGTHLQAAASAQHGGGTSCCCCRTSCCRCCSAVRSASGAGCTTATTAREGLPWGRRRRSQRSSSAAPCGRRAAPTAGQWLQQQQQQPAPRPQWLPRQHVRAGAAAAGGARDSTTAAGGGIAGQLDPDLDPGELDELMYELYCRSPPAGGGDGGPSGCGQLPHYCGPVELKEAPGAGVGLYATEAVTAGSLLLVTHPLALLRSGPGGGQPSSLDLAAALSAGALSPLAATWLTCLADGGASGSGGGGGGGGQRRRLAQLRSLFQQPFDAAAAAAPAGAGGAGAGGGGVACPLPPEAVVAVVAFNAYGEQRPDPVLDTMRAAVQQQQGEQQGEQGDGAAGEAVAGGCVGLWPAFSLINHSCAPVASYGLVGDVMVVRAAADLSPGQQVTISYIGRRALAPLSARRSYLLQHYGFLCACPRCTLEAAGQDQEEDQEEQEQGGSSSSSGSSGSSSRRQLLLPPELPDYLEGLHTTCGRMVAPHLAALLSGRRWREGPDGGGERVGGGSSPGRQQGQQPWAAAAAGADGGAATGAAAADGVEEEDVSDVVAELQQLSGYLSQCWQQVLRAAAAAGGSGQGGTGSGSSGSSDGAADSQGLTEQEVLWLEGGVFALLDQLMAAAAAAGLLQRIAAEPQLRLQPQPSGAAVAGVAAAVEAPVPSSAVIDVSAAGGVAGLAKGRGRRTQRDKDGGDSGTAAVAAAPSPPPPLAAPLAMRALAARRWRLTDLPPPYLETYVDLLSQASDVAGAVAPGSDLSTALAVRLLAGAAAAAGAESEAYREAELRCYDALSTKYGILDFDTYEQLLAACCRVYGAEYVRLPGVDPDPVAAVAAGGTAAAGTREVGARGVATRGDVGSDGEEGAGGGMAGLQLPAVEVEAEVVQD